MMIDQAKEQYGVVRKLGDALNNWTIQSLRDKKKYRDWKRKDTELTQELQGAREEFYHIYSQMSEAELSGFDSAFPELW